MWFFRNLRLFPQSSEKPSRASCLWKTRLRILAVVLRIPVAYFVLMQNAAYRLALLAGIGGLVLLMLAGPGDDIRTTLGVAVLGAAVLLAGLGKVIDVLGYVRDGATDAEEPQ